MRSGSMGRTLYIKTWDSVCWMTGASTEQVGLRRMGAGRIGRGEASRHRPPRAHDDLASVIADAAHSINTHLAVGKSCGSNEVYDGNVPDMIRAATKAGSTREIRVGNHS
jgi:hypothetical protein